MMYFIYFDSKEEVDGLLGSDRDIHNAAAVYILFKKTKDEINESYQNFLDNYKRGYFCGFDSEEDALKEFEDSYKCKTINCDESYINAYVSGVKFSTVDDAVHFYDVSEIEKHIIYCNEKNLDRRKIFLYEMCEFDSRQNIKYVFQGNGCIKENLNYILKNFFENKRTERYFDDRVIQEEDNILRIMTKSGENMENLRQMGYIRLVTEIVPKEKPLLIFKY